MHCNEAQAPAGLYREGCLPRHSIYSYLLSWNPQKRCACFFVRCVHPEDGALLSSSQFSGSK